MITDASLNQEECILQFDGNFKVKLESQSLTILIGTPTCNYLIRKKINNCLNV